VKKSTLALMIILTLTGFGLLLTACRPDPQKTVVALIFCDVTNSLTKEESRKVGAIAAEIVEGLPPGAKLKLYPIQKQTEIPTPIDIGTEEVYRAAAEEECKGPEITSDQEMEACEKVKGKEKRRAMIKKAVDDLYDGLNRGPDNRTCIINALGFASSTAHTDYRDAEKYDLRMFLISDMVEWCSITPLPDPVVKMDKRDINPEIKRAVAFQSEKTQPGSPKPDRREFDCNLAGVTIYSVFPTASDTSKVPIDVRPDREDVKTFWRAILKRCEVKDEQLIWVDSGDLTEQMKRLDEQYGLTQEPAAARARNH